MIKGSKSDEIVLPQTLYHTTKYFKVMYIKHCTLILVMRNSPFTGTSTLGYEDYVHIEAHFHHSCLPTCTPATNGSSML